MQATQHSSVMESMMEMEFSDEVEVWGISDVHDETSKLRQ